MCLADYRLAQKSFSVSLRGGRAVSPMLHPVFCPLLMRLGAKSKSNRDLACVF